VPNSFIPSESNYKSGKTMKTCPVCGKEVKSKISGKFCSEACKTKSHRGKPEIKKVSKRDTFSGNRLVMDGYVWYTETVKDGKVVAKKVCK